MASKPGRPRHRDALRQHPLRKDVGLIHDFNKAVQEMAGTALLVAPAKKQRVECDKRRAG
jgi:hypothetical protein